MSQARFDTYFHRRAARFAAFYRSEPVSRVLGRGALFDRLQFALDTAVRTGARRVLDVGCGSGPLLVELAERGIHAVGIDPAEAMVSLARDASARYPDLVEVRQQGWEDLEEVDGYDLAVALGVFDYVDDPAPLLGRMGRAAPRVAGSFPAPGLRLRLRQVRYGARGVHVHGYSEADIHDLGSAAGVPARRVVPLGRAGYAVEFARA